MKKYLISLALALALIVGISQAKAVTMEELMAELASLKQELSSLKSSLGALTLSAVSTDATLSTKTLTPTDTTLTATKTVSPVTLEASKTYTTSNTNTPACTLVSQKYTPTGTHHWTDNELDSSKHPEIKRYKIQWFSGTWSDWYYPGVNDVDTKETFRKVWRCFDDHNYEVEACDGTFKLYGTSAKISSSTTPVTSTTSQTKTNPVPTQPQALTVKAETPPSLILSKNLSYGLMNNIEVKKLQDFLIQEGYLQTGLNSGNYLGKTVSALQAFQKANNIQGDGRSVGPMTRNALLGTRPVGNTTLLARKCTPGSYPWLEVLSPNGGEVFNAGQQITVTWKSCNILPGTQLDIQILYDDQYQYLLRGPNVTLNDGQEQIILPNASTISSNGFLFGSHYKIKVRPYAALLQADSSDNSFTINGLHAQPASTPEPKCFPGSSRIPCVVTPPQCSGTPFAGGTGTTSDPYQICSCPQLQNMKDHLSSSFVLTKDIDCSDTRNWNNGAGFEPIFQSFYGGGTPFSGSFDGNNKVINNLYINRPNEGGVALFKGVQGSNIKNIGLTNVSIIGSEMTGSIAGEIRTNSIISNSYSTGSVKGTTPVGGLVGRIYSSKIENSHFSGEIEGNNQVGGLSGILSDSGAIISKSYSTGSITGTGAPTGGLIGHMANRASINDSYSVSNITGSHMVGGLAGFMYDNTIISNSYYGGVLTSNTSINIGGLVGDIYNTLGCFSSYWDTQTSGQATSVCGIGQTTSQMKQQSTFSGWDFANIWDINSSTNSGYPFLR